MSVRKGKIGRCPPHIREEVNRRLFNGEPESKVLPWLNANEEVLKVLDEYFHEEPVSSQNLSEWRKGGYEEWLNRREQLQLQKELNTYAGELAATSPAMAAGNVAMVGGQLSQLFSSLNIEDQKDLLKQKPALYVALVDCLAKLEKSQADRMKAGAAKEMVDIQRTRADQAEAKLKLEREKHAVKTCEAFIKWADDKRAREILEGKGNKQVKMEKLRQLMFPMDEPLDPKPLNG
jgi:hypothetical protein